jgi:hypothetical protein
MKEKPEKLCPYCHEAIGGGRSDKVFCDDQCRNAYNRNLRKMGAKDSGEDAREQIIRLIKRNHALLKKFNPRQDGDWIVDGGELYDAGFHAEYFTGCRLLENGCLQYFCFEQGWVKLEGNRMLLSVEPERLQIFDRTQLSGDSLNFG